MYLVTQGQNLYLSNFTKADQEIEGKIIVQKYGKTGPKTAVTIRT